MNNARLCDIFNQMATVMEILGQDRFRINSYRKLSRVIKELPVDVADMLPEGSLDRVPGVGKATIARISEFLRTGKIEAHEVLLEQIPATLLDLLKVSSLGPKGVRAVYNKLQVTSLPELQTAAENGSLATLPGFGEKKVTAVLEGIAFLAQSAGLLRLDQALEIAATIARFLRKRTDVLKVSMAGSLRRMKEMIESIVIVVVPTAPESGAAIIEAFAEADFVLDVLDTSSTKGSILVLAPDQPVQVDLCLTSTETLGATLLHCTGSQKHNARLQDMAVKTGFHLSQHGLFSHESAGQPIAATEEGIYQTLGLAAIDPRLREDRGEIEAAQRGSLPNLITEEDIRGDLHMHTTASDGRCDIFTLARHAQQIGYEYICITDHSRSSAIAHGLDEVRLMRQVEDIRRLNEAIAGIQILAGTEVDILANGRADFDDGVLAELDFVVASIHQGLNGPKEKTMTRIRKAMDNALIHCIGHPTGRLIGRRRPMEIDIQTLLEHAAQTRTALEVNANPYRLDLNDTHCRMAMEAGVKLAICTDSHQAESLELMTFGVSTAARGWVTRSSVVNTLPWADLRVWLREKR